MTAKTAKGGGQKQLRLDGFLSSHSHGIVATEKRRQITDYDLRYFIEQAKTVKLLCSRLSLKIFGIYIESSPTDFNMHITKTMKSL